MSDETKAPFRTGPDLLDIRNLVIEAKSGGDWKPIVDNVSLTLKRGAVLGLIGESGAGKSTIGLAAMGFVRAGCRVAGGQTVFNGTDLLAVPEQERRQFRGTRIAYVAQSAAASFNPGHRIIDQTVETCVARGIMSAKQARLSALDLFEQLQLPDPARLGQKYPHQISGGQLQRAMTAMALLCQPDLVIFDEPTTALDVTTQVDVLLAIRNALRENETAAIYISHDLAVVSQMADRIMVLRHGCEVEEARTRDMLSSPQQDYTKSLWAVRKLEKPEVPTDEIILDLRNVDASYGGGGGKVLRDVSLVVPRGRTLAVVGESGSGKSTLGRVISGLLKPSAGEIKFAGSPLPPSITTRNKEQLRRIQLIHQSADTALNPRQSVGDLIGRRLELYSGLYGRARKQRIVELLDLIELDVSFIDRRPAELSGGQKQRVSIARALAAQPELIVCDEVTSALDQIVQEGILKLLMDVQKETGVSYFFITHDIAAVRAIADEIAVLYRGRIIEQGLKSQILSPPYPPYTERLLASVPDMDPDWLTGLIARRELDSKNGELLMEDKELHDPEETIYE